MRIQGSKLGTVLLSMGVLVPCAWASTEATVAGTVRDAQGVPQVGALVELLGSNTSVLARAMTDDRGHYLLPVALTGDYRLRASAAFLNPAMREGVHLRNGVHLVADFTMVALFQAGAWLPAERRTVSQPSDDWRWALRSTAGRPLLRVVSDQPSLASQGISSSAERQPGALTQGHIAMLAGDGAFGGGGTHQVFSFDRATGVGDTSVLQADLGDHTASGSGGSMDLAAGLEQEKAFGGQTRLVVNLASHPEIISANNTGLQVLRSAVTEQIVLGDVVMVDAGTLFTAENLLGTRVQSSPYLRTAVRFGSEDSLELRLATDRSLQNIHSLDTVALPLNALADENGRPVLRRGLHEEVAYTHAGESASVSVAAYRDSLPVVSIQGTGETVADDFGAQALVADAATGAFRMAVPGLSAGGFRVAWKQTWTQVLAVSFEAETGSALTLLDGEEPMALSSVPGRLRPRKTVALAGEVHLATHRTGTDINARYRWQPLRTLTQVNQFGSPESEAYATLRLRQRIFAGRRLKGVNAVVEATNLLAQGYQPVLGADGQTLYLAQVPRSVQGGLAFTF